MANAAPALPIPSQVYWSKSKQFRVTGSQTRRLIAPKKDEPEVIALTGPELAISCERVKLAFLRELGASDQWQGRVLVTIRPFEAGNSDVIYASTLYPNGWHYQMSIPDVVEPAKLVRGLVQVMLLEMANRESRGRCAEIPVWLREGMLEQILGRQQRDTLLLEATALKEEVVSNVWQIDGLNREQFRQDPLTKARDWMRDHKPFSFSDLNVPTEDHLYGEMWGTYRYSSQLFVSELQQLQDGKSGLQIMIRQLPRHFNAQFALLNGFKSHFNSALDVEKWWSVASLNFTSRDGQRKLPGDASLATLAEILQPPVEVAGATNAIPQRIETTLQTLIEKMDYAQQKPMLRNTLRQLETLQGNVPPELLNLIQDYRVTLETYLYRRDKLSAGDGKGSANARPLIRDTITQLAFLDLLREDFKRLGVKAETASKQ